MKWARTTLAIYERELLAYFFSPMYYAVATVFVIVIGVIFWIWVAAKAPGIPKPPPADMGPVFAGAGFLFMFFLPVVTMRLIAEEFRRGTIEPLMTAPVSDWQVVLGKHFAAVTVVAAMLLPTSAYAVTYYVTGDPGPDTGKLILGYLGILLTGGLFCSVGLFASTLSRDQVVAAILGILFCFSFALIGWARYSHYVQDTPWLKNAVLYVGHSKHLEALVDGMVDTRDIIYFLSLTAFFLFVSVRVVESRKWRA